MPSSSLPLLRDLSLALRELHKALLDAELANFPSAQSAGGRLALLVEHPSFAWLHALSGLIVEIDELEDADAGVSPSPGGWRTAVEQLLGPVPAAHAEFRSRYLALLQSAPEVAITTGTVRRLLERL